MRCVMCSRPLFFSALPSMAIGLKCAKKRGLWAGEQMCRPRAVRNRADARQSDWIAMLEEGLLPQTVEAPPIEAGEPTDDFERPIVHRIVSAAGQPLPAVLGPRSIFDLCRLSDMAAADVLSELSQQQAGTPQDRPLVTRDVGVTRAAGCAYPANRWTPEREEQERQRRAKQRPPRPTKQKFRMKGTRQWADAQS